MSSSLRRTAVLIGSLYGSTVSALSLASLRPCTIGTNLLVGRASAARLMSTVRMQGVEAPIEPCAAEITPSDVTPAAWGGDLLVLPFYAAEKDKSIELSGEMAELDESVGGALAGLIADHDFTGAAGSSAVVSLPPGLSARRLAVVGLGEKKEFKQPAARAFGGALATLIIGQRAKVVGASLPAEASTELQQAALEAALFGLTPDTRYKSSTSLKGEMASKMPKLETLHLLGGSDSGTIEAAKNVAAGMVLTKGVVGSPANYLTPTSMAATAAKLAEDFDSLRLTVLEKEECEARGMGAYLGVSQGATEPPKFIHMTYTPPGPVSKKIALVGKGLTFDSGGYNIKAGAGSMIEKMKFDMGGAGAVLGTARVIAGLAPAGVEVHFIVAACENMVSAEAMRPGDILTASNEMTIEVINTDAEGRLTLADALVYAEGLGDVDAIVDVATLTGAVIVALGPEYAGLWTSDDALGDKLLASASEGGELLWKMPLAKEYMEQCKSTIADLKNVGAGGGGSITAALFLKEFVKETPWAHLDIAGPVWDDKKGGATGYGVRTLTKFVESYSS